MKKFALAIPRAARSSAGRLGVKRADAVHELVVRQLAGIWHVDEDVEVIAHEAIRQHRHAGKRRNAPKPFNEARLQIGRASCRERV